MLMTKQKEYAQAQSNHCSAWTRPFCSVSQFHPCPTNISCFIFLKKQQHITYTKRTKERKKERQKERKEGPTVVWGQCDSIKSSGATLKVYWRPREDTDDETQWNVLSGSHTERASWPKWHPGVTKKHIWYVILSALQLLHSVFCLLNLFVHSPPCEHHNEILLAHFLEAFFLDKKRLFSTV